MTSRCRIGPAIGTAALLILVATGCGTDESPAAEVADTRGTTARTSPTDAAVDTVRAWVAARNDAVAGGTTSDADALTEDCELCDRLLASGPPDGRAWRRDEARVIDRAGDRATVAADITVAESRPRERWSLRFVVAVGDPATIRELGYLLPRAGGAAGSVGGTIGR